MAPAPRLLCFSAPAGGGADWMPRVLRGIASRTGLDRAVHGGDVPEGPERVLVLCPGGAPPGDLLARSDAGFVRVIRDPRDLLIAACHAHHAVPDDADTAEQAHMARLHGLRDAAEKLRLEMANGHGAVLDAMLAWPDDDARIITLRHEDLAADRDCYLFQAALSHLGLDETMQKQGVAAFRRQSPFGGARAGKGRQIRWPREFPRALGPDYAHTHGAALAALGYAADDRWIARLNATPRGPGFAVPGRAARARRAPGLKDELRASGLVAVADKETPEHLRAFGFAPDVVIDVGVDTGTPFLYRAFPQAHFLLVDPREASRAALRNPPESFDFHAVALGAEPGEAELRIPVTKSGASGAMAGILPRIDAMSNRLEGTETRLVPMVTLDSLTGDLPGRFGLKIDTEGYEYPILQGAAATLRRCDFVILEVSVTRRFQGVAPPSQLVAVLAEAGLELRDMLRSTGDGQGGPTPRLFDMLFARWHGP